MSDRDRAVLPLSVISLLLSPYTGRGQREGGGERKREVEREGRVDREKGREREKSH